MNEEEQKLEIYLVETALKEEIEFSISTAVLVDALGSGAARPACKVPLPL